MISVNKRVGRKGLRGMSMMELGIVLVVVALIGAGVYRAFASNMRRNDIADNRDAINSAITCIQVNYGKKNLYPRLTSATLVTSGCMPEELRDRDATGGLLASATNKYGGPVTVAAATGTGCTASTCRNIVWENVPRSQCFDLAMSIEQSSFALGIAAEGDVKPVGGQVNPDTLSTLCEAAEEHDIIITVSR